MSTCGTVYPPTSSSTPKASATPAYTLFTSACANATSGCPNLGISNISATVNNIQAQSASMTINGANRQIVFSFLVNFGSTTVSTASVNITAGNTKIASFTIGNINVSGTAMFQVTFNYTSV
jgi:hypothetical protein